MKKDMPLEGLRWSRDSGSALYDTPPNGRSRTGWGRGLNNDRRRSSMKTRNRGTERGAFRVVVIQRTLKHRTEYEVYEEGNLENGDFISGHFRSWSFPVMVIFNFGYFHCILLFSQLSSINQ